jgi:hypothetical protein
MTSRLVPLLESFPRRWRWALCGAALLLPAPVQAQNELDLSWDAPASCPQREAVRERIRELAGQALWHAEPLRAAGRIVEVAQGYRLTLTVRDRGELRTRTMVSSSCVDLAGAAAVALGLLLRQGPNPSADPADPGSAGAGATRSLPEAEERTEPQPKQSSPVSPAPSTDKGPSKPGEDSGPALPPDDGASGARGWELLLRGPVAMLDVGPLPRPSLALGAGLGVRASEWRVVLSGRAGFAQSWLMPGTVDVGAKVGRWQAELSVCRGWQIAGWEVAPCLALGVERLWARGTGSGVTARSAQSISLAPGASVVAHLHFIDGVAIFATAGALIETSRPRLVVEGLGEIGHAGSVQFFTGLGPEWIF